jgi:tetratricopeptide (TPR) repeat protein
MSITHPNYWFLSSQWFYAQQRLIDQDREQPKLNEAEMLQTLQDSLHAGRLHLWSRLNAYPIRVPDFHYCLFIIERLHRLEARLAIDSGEWKSANEAVEKCWRANPDQIETLLELIPVARSKFDPEKVESWIRLYADPLEKHLKLFPDDTLVGNNVAWLYANLDYRLERAKQLSTRVTEILVDDHMYLDTLGEVEFRLGNRSRAIEIARQCQKLAPREAHYHRQLKRYLFGLL